jgi:hypothetical protein
VYVTVVIMCVKVHSNSAMETFSDEFIEGRLSFITWSSKILLLHVMAELGHILIRVSHYRQLTYPQQVYVEYLALNLCDLFPLSDLISSNLIIYIELFSPLQ